MSVYDLTGRKALVTGGARGLGAGMAEALARAGAAVVIADVQEELGKAAADSIRPFRAADASRGSDDGAVMANNSVPELPPSMQA